MGFWGLNVTQRQTIKVQLTFLLIIFTQWGCQLTFYTRSPSRGLMGQNCFSRGPSNLLDVKIFTLENVIVSIDQNQMARTIYVLSEEVSCL